MSPRMPLPWQRAATGANLLSPDGSLGVTIFEEMTTLALSTGAINLGQGFPDEDGPVEIKEAAQAAIAAGANQYAPGKGILPVRAWDFVGGKVFGIYTTMDNFTGRDEKAGTR